MPARDADHARRRPQPDLLAFIRLPDHLLIGLRTYFGVGKAPAAEALRQIQNGSGLAPGGADFVQADAQRMTGSREQAA